ncbi:MAG: zinc-dependent alcohol dehydrogenase family protein [Candidatus Nanopelagicales bacterium]
MQVWAVRRPGPAHLQPMDLEQRAIPRPGRGEVLVEVAACAVCRTDLHLAEGDLSPRRPGVVPGHEVVGRIVDVGAGVAPTRAGERVGIGWLRRTCGHCARCLSGSENLCHDSLYTGWDADGGFAHYAVAPDDFVHVLPPGYTDVEAAPLLCAGIIGWRALRRAQLPERGRLGLYGFGAAAHLTMQVAISEGHRVHVMTRGANARALATALGAASVGDPTARPPEPLDAAIIFAPAGELVPPAMEALDDAGTVVCAGIHMSAIPALDYTRHVFRERQLRSVTANTRSDARDFLAAVSRSRVQVRTTVYAFADAARALEDLAADRLDGVAVLDVGARG